MAIIGGVMIWVTGDNGMLGHEVCEALKAAQMYFVGSGHEVDITDPRAIDAFITKTESTHYVQMHKFGRHGSDSKVNWIINCAALTDVNKIQNNEEEAARAKLVNTTGSLNIARLARSRGAHLIHISTDYVFDGKSSYPYKESDPRNPLNIYGETKSAGEDAITSSMSQYYIIRTSTLFGVYGNNFVTKVISKLNSNDEAAFPNDQIMSPTSCSDLAQVITLIIDRSENATSIFGRNSALSYGIWHFTNAGQTSFSNFAKKIAEIATSMNLIQSKCKITEAKTATMIANDNTIAPRPLYSVLDCNKIVKELRLKVPTWDGALKEYMSDKRFKI